MTTKDLIICNFCKTVIDIEEEDHITEHCREREYRTDYSYHTKCFWGEEIKEEA